jgi:threonine/homoserine/homoserine lactone efflux protein
MEKYALLSGITLVAMASPGPDMLLLIRNGLTCGRRVGFATVLGICGGLLVHVSLSVAGLAWLITRNVYIYDTVRLLGAGYLLFIGIKALKFRGSLNLDVFDSSQQRSGWQGLRDGFFCNLLNPKVTIYIFSIFTQFIMPCDSTWAKTGYGLVIVLTSLCGWSLFILLVQQSFIRQGLARFNTLINRLFGGVMIALGLRIALVRDSRLPLPIRHNNKGIGCKQPIPFIPSDSRQ